MPGPTADHHRAAHTVRGLGLLAVVLGAAGCFPATLTEMPPLRGRVLDATGRPVPGAEIVSTVPPDYGRYPPVVLAHTGVDGRFDRPEETRWFLYIVPADIFREPRRISARLPADASAYRTVDIHRGVRPFGLGGPANRVDLGDLYLTGY